MKLTICWMYHDIMNLYGDRGNIAVLEKRCHDRHIDTEVIYCDMGCEYDVSEADIIFLGGGADKEQGILMNDLLKRKNDLQRAMEKGAVFLLICGGYQLFGKYYIDANEQRIEGLNFFDYYTISGKREERCIGNVEIECMLDGQAVRIAGFENHGGQTHGVKTPLGKVIYGKGNNMNDKEEGFYNGQVIGTYLHGPLLPRNPELADLIIQKALELHGESKPLSQLDDTLELQAKKVLCDKLRMR